MAAPRPYGVGPYGTGRYERYTGSIYDVAGRSGLTFSATASKPSITICPVAVSSLIFSVWADGEISWPGWAPCEPGIWTPAGPCEVGGWVPAEACSTGTWEEKRLEEMAE